MKRAFAFCSGLGFALAAFAVGQNISVTERTCVAVPDAETQVDVAAGGEALLVQGDSDVTVRAQAGGKVRLGAFVDDQVTNAPWAAKVALWLDASHEDTLLPETNTAGVVKTVTVGGTQTAAIVRWLDRRPEQTTWRAYNNRGLGVGADEGTYTSVMPYVISNGCNKLSYVSMDVCKAWARRIPFVKVVDGVEKAGNGGDYPPNAIPAKYVIMVFGSQNGGGCAVISDLKRKDSGSTAETGIFNSSRDTRLDGVAVDPTTTGLNGGWQVLSFDASDASIEGIGFARPSYATTGGQNYGEILVFGTKPTDAEIQSVEVYLANKWGIATYSAPASGGEVRLYGTGAAQIEAGEAKLGGSFKGTIAVKAGATLQLTDTASIPTNAAAIEAGSETALQYDPERTDLTTDNSHAPDKLTGASHESLYALKNAVKPGYYPLKGYKRGPAFVDSENDGLASWGPKRRWYAYSTTWTVGRQNASGTSVNPGNTTRFVDENAASGNTFNTRTMFMVLDTSAGAGTPFLDTSVYNSDSRYVTNRGADSQIFHAKSDSAFVTNSPCYLNGIAVKSGERGYNGRGELLSCVFTQDMPVKCFGYYGQVSSCDLRHGEIILYQAALTDAQRKDTEAYLMNKWLGIVPKGYGDISGMTVSGAGTVKAADGVHRPQFAESFSGAFDLTAAAPLVFTASEAQLGGALTLANAAATLPSDLTVRVDVADGQNLASGDHVLLAAKSLTGAETLTLNMTGLAERHQVQYELVRNDTQIILRRTLPGCILLLR